LQKRRVRSGREKYGTSHKSALQQIKLHKKAARLYRQFRRVRGNPSAKDLYAQFQGKTSRKTTPVVTPTGTPKNLYKLGRLRKLKYTGGSIAFPGGAKSPYLAADTSGKLHVAGGAYRINSVARNMGTLHQIEYETSKPHLGAPGRTLFYHRFGEDGGTKPRLHVDSEGLLRIRGGSYSIGRDGILD
jgi:hypothetical protein